MSCILYTIKKCNLIYYIKLKSKTMKKLFTLLALTISFGINAQISTNETINSGTNSSAIGLRTEATGTQSVAIGYDSSASGDYSLAVGGLSTAAGEFGVAIGNDAFSSRNGSMAIGYSVEALASFSIAMGFGTRTVEKHSFVIGRYNIAETIDLKDDSHSPENAAFTIGNGTGYNDRSDAFKVLFNGNTMISNDLTVNGEIITSSDARLKTNIVSLGSTLSKLLLIDGKSYTMIKDGKQKIGVLAQEIMEVFPELVSEDENEMLAVNYQGLVPVLINALKEQESKYLEQEERLERLERLVAQLD